MNVSHFLRLLKGKHPKIMVVRSPDRVVASAIAAAALDSKIRHLTNELRIAAKELGVLKSSIPESAANDRKVNSDELPNLVCEILVGFCVRDASELPERRILEMCSGDPIAVRATLGEMCRRGLLAPTQAEMAEATYAVTSLGQNRVYAYRAVGASKNRSDEGAV